MRLAILFAGALAGACSGSGDESTSPAVQGTAEPVDARGQSEPEEIAESLPALGYVDYSPVEVDPSEGEGVVLHDRDRARPGYNLLGSVPVSTARLFDNDGRIVKVWENHEDEGWNRVRLLENGDLLVVGKSRPAPGVTDDPAQGALSGVRGFIRRLDWDGGVIWNRDIPAHHDVTVTPEGRILTLTEHVRHPDGAPEGVRVIDHFMALLSQEGELLEEISLYDVLDEVPGLLQKRFIDVPSSVEAGIPFDILHVNSARWMSDPHLAGRDPIYALRNVLVSSRSQSMLAIIDWDTHEVLWTWGRGEVTRQHEATVQEDGTILLLDNGSEYRGWSRVVEVDPLTREIVWTYRAATPEEFFTPARGTAQRLAGGNVLISNSYAGSAFEVDRSGRTVWRFLVGDYSQEKLERGLMGGRASIRVERYDPDFVEPLLAR